MGNGYGHSSADAVRHKIIYVHTPKHALIDKMHFSVGTFQTQSHAQMLAIGAEGVGEKYLATHAQVHHQRRSVIQGQPQELPPPTDPGDLPTYQGIAKVRDSRLVAAHRPTVQDLH